MALQSYGAFRVFSRLAPPPTPLALRRECRGAFGIALVLGLSFAGTPCLSAQGSAASPARGTAFIVLRVIDSSQGRSLAGTATISELHLAAGFATGVDTLKDLPEGAWSVRVRSLGYEPRIVLLKARVASSKSAVDTVRMIPLGQTLAPVNVIARHDQHVLDDIDERMRVASGTLIKGGDPFLATAFDPSDALRAGRGFFWKGPATVVTRGCQSAPSNLPGARGKLASDLAVYLDGVRIRGGLGTLDNLVRPHEILAIETYPEVLSAPFLWRTADACAVVAFWTKHRTAS